MSLATTLLVLALVAQLVGIDVLALLRWVVALLVENWIWIVVAVVAYRLGWCQTTNSGGSPSVLSGNPLGSTTRNR